MTTDDLRDLRPVTGNYSQLMASVWYGHLYQLDEWLRDVKAGYLIDDDGYGSPVKDGLIDEQALIYPSDRSLHVPLDCTHIMWYNR